MRVEPKHYYEIAAASPDLSLKVGALARERLGGLQGIAAEPPKPRVIMIGNRWDSACSELRRFLARNQITYDWLTPDAPDLSARWPGTRPSDDDCPAVRLADGTLLNRPATRDLAKLLGLQTSTRLAEYDTLIIGGGPAGLAAAVYGASEGLRTVVVEREAPGGQAGTSSRIENYLGFPSGVSGDELASRALQQAKRLGRRFWSRGPSLASMRACVRSTRWRRCRPGADPRSRDRRHMASARDRWLRSAHRQRPLLWRGTQRSERYPWTRRSPHWCRKLSRSGCFVLCQSRTHGDACRQR